jgi:histidyl-tRNA synthetase
MGGRTFKGPRGTRDMYPEDMLRRRYLLQTWRDTSIRHGFEEIEGPMFEESDLYAVKSGEGILGELFQAFSGKSPEEVEQVKASGRAPFALRPEFTPTLARMYAARAANLPRPTRWFMAGPFFRAERPQRGRLREFLQWNCDVIGGDGGPDVEAEADYQVIDTCCSLLAQFGILSTDCRIAASSRRIVASTLREQYVLQGNANAEPTIAPEYNEAALFALLDRRHKLSDAEFRAQANSLGLDIDHFDAILERCLHGPLQQRAVQRSPWGADEFLDRIIFERNSFGQLRYLAEMCSLPFSNWFKVDHAIIRGLAYYTGTVFEVVAEGERAVAGGGRYDNLIELLGGPPTPAVGFAMGDVVLSLLLEDKGLMPEGPELMDALSRRPASLRPEAFVLGANDEASDAPVRRLVADLRRGVENPAYLARENRKPWHADRYEPVPDDPISGGVRPLHARSSDKRTRNLKKLLNDAERQFARFAVILHGDGADPGRVQIKDMDARKDLTPADVPGLPPDIAEFSADPKSPVYAGRAIAALTR